MPIGLQLADTPLNLAQRPHDTQRRYAREVVLHTSLLPGGSAPVAPSAVRAGGKTFMAIGFE